MHAQAHESFMRWYGPIHEPFIRYCAGLALGVMETEDLAQEAILATLESFSRVRDKEKLLGYMIGVARNIARNQRRRQKFRGDWDQNALEELESRTRDPELALDIHYLLKAMEQLPAAQKEALLLFEVGGFSIEEVGRIQHCAPGAVKTRLSRARRELRRLLGEDGRPMPLARRLAIYTSILM
jgi:RNA polymerase sigma-70 factor (ECF subfamily)